MPQPFWRLCRKISKTLPVLLVIKLLCYVNLSFFIAHRTLKKNSPRNFWKILLLLQITWSILPRIEKVNFALSVFLCYCINFVAVYVWKFLHTLRSQSKCVSTTYTHYWSGPLVLASARVARSLPTTDHTYSSPLTASPSCLAHSTVASFLNFLSILLRPPCVGVKHYPGQAGELSCGIRHTIPPLKPLQPRKSGKLTHRPERVVTLGVRAVVEADSVSKWRTYAGFRRSMETFFAEPWVSLV